MLISEEYLYIGLHNDKTTFSLKEKEKIVKVFDKNINQVECIVDKDSTDESQMIFRLGVPKDNQKEEFINSLYKVFIELQDYNPYFTVKGVGDYA